MRPVRVRQGQLGASKGGAVNGINSLADLKPGDIGITKMGGFIPGTFPVAIGQLLCKESFRVGPFRADHVLICVEANRPCFAETCLAPDGHSRAVQAMPRGAEEIALTPDKHWTDGVVWFRLQEDYPGQAEDAAAIARLFVEEKIPYSFLSYLALAAWSRGLKAERLEKWIDRRRESSWEIPSHQTTSKHRIMLPAEAICSVLVDQAWSLAGKRVITGVKRQCVTPGKMAIQLNSRPGVIRGGPGFLAEMP
jgi:hypothetical protein